MISPALANEIEDAVVACRVTSRELSVAVGSAAVNEAARKDGAAFVHVLNLIARVTA